MKEKNIKFNRNPKGRPVTAANGKFKPHNKVIWDSGSGYDYAVFIKLSDDGGTCTIELRSGDGCFNYVSVSSSGLKPYSTKLVAKLAKKYGYERTFKKSLI